MVFDIRCAKRAPPRNRRCFGAGEACGYSNRRPRLGGAQPSTAGPMASGGWASDQSIYGPATLPAGCDRNTHASVALPDRPGESAALQQYGSMSLKRFVNKMYVRVLVVALRVHIYTGAYLNKCLLVFSSQKYARVKQAVAWIRSLVHV